MQDPSQTSTKSLESLKQIIFDALEDLKAQDITALDVSGLTTVTDSMVICSGTSNKHVQSIAKNLVDAGKAEGIRPLSVGGLEEGEWVLVDYQDVVVHIMLPKTRDFYNLEKLWSFVEDTRATGSEESP